MSLFIVHNVTVMCSRLTVNDVEGSFSHFHFPPCLLFILTILLLTILPSENEVNEPVPSAPKKAIKTVNRYRPRKNVTYFLSTYVPPFSMRSQRTLSSLLPLKRTLRPGLPFPWLPKRLEKRLVNRRLSKWVVKYFPTCTSPYSTHSQTQRIWSSLPLLCQQWLGLLLFVHHLQNGQQPITAKVCTLSTRALSYLTPYSQWRQWGLRIQCNQKWCPLAWGWRSQKRHWGWRWRWSECG